MFATWTDVGKHRFRELAREHREAFVHQAHIRRAAKMASMRERLRRR